MIFFSLRSFIPSIFVSLLMLAFSLSYPWFFSELIKRLELEISSSLFVILYLFSWFMSYALVHLREILSFHQSSSIVFKMQKSFYQSYLYGGLRKGTNIGKFYYLFHNIFDSIFSIIEVLIFTIAPLAVQVIAMLVILALLYPLKYAIFYSITLMIFTFLLLWRQKKIQLFHRLGERYMYLTGFHLQELTHNLETIHSFQLKEPFLSQFSKLSHQFLIHEEKTQKFGEVTKLILLGIFFIPLYLTTMCALKDTQNQLLGISDIVLITSYSLNILIPLNTVGQSYRDIRKKYLQLKEIELFIQSHMKKIKSTSRIMPFNVSEDPHPLLHLKNVSLVLDHHPIVESITLSLSPGSIWLLKGKNGAGKSSLVKIIAGLYIPTSGDIYVNIPKPDEESLLGYVSISPQSSLMFEDSILYNITFDKENYDKDRLKLALELSLLNEKLDLFPDGINTILGKNFHKLSGGEQQLLSIARAIYKKAQIYIFDESTSFLDETIRTKVLENITKIPLNPAIILVEHGKTDLNISHMKEIFLEGGKIKN